MADVISNLEFNNGTSKGLITFMPLGGQLCPILAVGVKLDAKKAQKKLTNNLNSETRNIAYINRKFL